MDYEQLQLSEIKASLAELKPKESELQINKNLQTLLIDEIESIWDAIDKEDNWQPFYQKLQALNS